MTSYYARRWRDEIKSKLGVHLDRAITGPYRAATLVWQLIEWAETGQVRPTLMVFFDRNERFLDFVPYIWQMRYDHTNRVYAALQTLAHLFRESNPELIHRPDCAGIELSDPNVTIIYCFEEHRWIIEKE